MRSPPPLPNTPMKRTESYHRNLFLGRVLCLFLVLLWQPFSAAAAARLQPAHLRCDYRDDPLGVEVANPRLSWVFESGGSQRGLRQSAFQILVATRPDLLRPGRADLWDSGKVSSDQMAHVE